MGHHDDEHHPRVHPKHAGGMAILNLIFCGACVYYFYKFGWQNPDISYGNKSTSACWTGGNRDALPNYEILISKTGATDQTVPSSGSPMTVNVTNNFIVWFQWGFVNACVGLVFALV